MAVAEVTCKSSKSYSKSKSFSTFGEFVVEEYDIEYAFDPEHESNARIVDINKAPCNETGQVVCHGNARLIRPTNQKPEALLVDVPNRGRPTVFSFNRPRAHEMQQTTTPAGDGFLFRHGFAVLSVGWQFDAERMKLDVPDALDEGLPISGESICQMQPGRDLDSLFVGQGGIPTYKATGRGTLYERQDTQTPHEKVDPDEWQFGRNKDGDWDDSTAFISRRAGFKKGMIYTLVYETIGAPVVGLGLLAMRDAVSHFKYEFDWVEGAPDCALGYGASQTGRFLRHFLFENMNEDEQGRQIFDAVIPHIAGGQRGDFNHRFAQPGSMGVPGPGQRFPFATTPTTDPSSGRRTGLLDECKKKPKVISTNTSWEYWRGDAALIHVSTDGERDITPGEDERIYMFAGTHHVNGILPITDKLLLLGERVSYTLNTVSYLPLLRAVLVNAKDWVRNGREPPESKHPCIEEGSLVSRQQVIERFATDGNFSALPDDRCLTALWHAELGGQVDDGVCEQPARLLKRYPALVSDVGQNLNEVAGIRLPEISVPIGIHSGWNPRHPDHGATDQNSTFVGFSRFDLHNGFPATAEETRRLVEEATEQLVADRYVLQEDRQLVIDNAMKRYEIAQSLVTAIQQE